jgi:hypothetical protein
MPTNDPSAELSRVSCATCLKEVPVSEATVPEATDYFLHFCGLECYEIWKHQQEAVPVQPPHQSNPSA